MFLLQIWSETLAEILLYPVLLYTLCHKHRFPPWLSWFSVLCVNMSHLLIGREVMQWQTVGVTLSPLSHQPLPHLTAWGLQFEFTSRPSPHPTITEAQTSRYNKNHFYFIVWVSSPGQTLQCSFGSSSNMAHVGFPKNGVTISYVEVFKLRRKPHNVQHQQQLLIADYLSPSKSSFDCCEPHSVI